MLKRLMILGAMMAMMLVAAVPAFAQDQGGPVTATGVLGEAYTVGEDPTLNYDLTDEATGTTYVLTSGFVDMSPFVGEEVTIEGVPIGGAEGAPPALNVTSLEPADGGPAAQEIVVVTGALEAVAKPLPEGPTHTITEASTGDVYDLTSDTQGVDLSQYEGQSVAIYGIFQTAGARISDFEDPTDVPIYVTSIESLEPAPVEPPADTPSFEPDAIITGVIETTTDPQAEGPVYTVTEDGTGDEYGIFSNLQDGGVDLSQYVGQRVTITSYFQTEGTGTAGYDLTDLLIYVESIESLEPAPVEQPAKTPAEPVAEEPVAGEPAENGGGTTTEVSPVTGESVLPDTGGVSMAAMALIFTLLIGGSLLAYRVTR